MGLPGGLSGILPIATSLLGVVDPGPQTTSQTSSISTSSASITSSLPSTTQTLSSVLTTNALPSASATSAPSSTLATSTSSSIPNASAAAAAATTAATTASASGPTCNQTCIIISASVGGAVLLALLIAIILCIRWRRRKAARSQSRLEISPPLETETAREKGGPPVLNVLPPTPVMFTRISTFFSQPLAPVREEGRRPNRAEYTDLETGSISGASSRDPSPQGRSLSEERPSRGMGWAK